MKQFLVKSTRWNETEVKSVMNEKELQQFIDYTLQVEVYYGGPLTYSNFSFEELPES